MAVLKEFELEEQNVIGGHRTFPLQIFLNLELIHRVSSWVSQVQITLLKGSKENVIHVNGRGEDVSIDTLLIPLASE